MTNLFPFLRFAAGCRWLLAALLLLAASVAQAQVPTWAATVVAAPVATGNTSGVSAVATDAAGNVFVAGIFIGQVTFGSTVLASTNPGLYDVFVAKYLPASGTWAWAVRAGGTSSDLVGGLAVSGSNVYVTGTFVNDAANSRNVTFGGRPVRGTSASVSADIFLAKYQDNGSSATLAWTQVGGGTGDDQGFGLAVNNSSVYLTGRFQNTTANAAGVLFGGDGTTAGTVAVAGASTTLNGDLLLAKYTDQGSTATLGWTQVGGGINTDGGQAVAVSGSSVYVAGYLANSTTNTNAAVFGGNGTTAGTVAVLGASATPNLDLLLAKYTDQGSSATLAWTQVGGGTADDQATALAVSGSSVYVAGYLDNNRANANAVVLGGSGTTAGTVAVAGASATPSPDLVLVKYLDAGVSATPVWAQVGGGTADDQATAVAVRGAAVFVGGYLTNSSANASAAVLGGSGTTAGTVAVAGATPSVSRDLLLAKYLDAGSSATLSWAKVGGSEDGDQAYGLAISGRQVYTGGTARPPATFDATQLSGPMGTFFGALASLTDPTLAPLATAPGASQPALALTLYPNPARHGAATLLAGATPGAPVQVLDALGRVVRTTTADATGTARLAGLPAGLYVVRAGAGAGRLSVE